MLLLLTLALSVLAPGEAPEEAPAAPEYVPLRPVRPPPRSIGSAAEIGAGVNFWILRRSLRRGRVALGPPENHERACQEGSAEDCVSLGVAYVLGERVRRDPQRGARLFVKACESGSAPGCTNLARLIGAGEGVPRDGAREAWTLERACGGGDPKGCADLADMYARGLRVPQDDNRARQAEQRAERLYREGCEAGVAEACLGLSWQVSRGVSSGRRGRRARSYQKRACQLGLAEGCATYANSVDSWGYNEQAMRLYARACDEGDSMACEEVASWLRSRHNRRADPAKAAGLWLRICEMGLAHGCAAAAAAYAEGDGLPRDLEKAAELRGRACALGTNPESCREAAAMYFDGNGVGMDHTKAAAYWQEGCRSQRIACCSISDELSCANLAALYYEGDGVARDRARAARLFDDLAKRGDDHGRFARQVMLETDAVARQALAAEPDRGAKGSGVSAPDEWLRWACSVGSSTGCYRLALELEAWIVEIRTAQEAASAQEAARLYARACGTTVPAACYRLSRMYAGGRGVAADAAKARALQEQGCEGGDLDSCVALAEAFESVVHPDPLGARHRFETTCASGSAEGCTGLGYILWSGEWIVRDRKKAFALFEQACAGGHRLACLLRRLETREPWTANEWNRRGTIILGGDGRSAKARPANARKGSITGALVDEQGLPLGGVALALCRFDKATDIFSLEEGVASVLSSPDGSFEWQGVPAGTYVVAAVSQERVCRAQLADKRGRPIELKLKPGQNARLARSKLVILPAAAW